MNKVEQFKSAGLALARSPKTRRWGFRFLVTMAVIGVLGFFAAPPLVKYVLVEQATLALKRPVSLESVAVNPYTLALTLRGLRVRESEGGEVLAGFDELYVNADLSSLLRAAPVVSALRVENPRFRLVRLGANRYNISDLIDEFLAKPAGPTPRFALFNIEVKGGELIFDDRLVDEKHVVSDIALRLPFISSLPSFAATDVEPYFSAIVDGAPLELKGATRPFDKSLETRFDLALDGFDLTRLNDYLPADRPLYAAAGKLDGDVRLTFRQSGEKSSTIALTGRLVMQGLDLRQKNQGVDQPFATIRGFELDLEELDVLKQQISLNSMRFNGVAIQGPTPGAAGLLVESVLFNKAKLDLRDYVVAASLAALEGVGGRLTRESDGRISWLAPLKWPQAAAAPAADKKAVVAKPVFWKLDLDKLTLKDAKLQFDDKTTRPMAQQTLLVEQLTLERVSNQAGREAQLQLLARLNDKGEIKLQGSLQAEPTQAKLALEASGIPLLPLQPYFNEKVGMTVTRGQLAAKGALAVQMVAGAPKLAYQGDLTIGEFASVDKANGVDFLRWKSFHVGAIDAQTAPLDVKIGEVALSDFYSRLVISAQGKLNLLQILNPQAATEPAASSAPAPVAGEAAPATAPQPSAPVAARPPPPPIQVGKVTLQGGTINFSDNFIKPNYSARLTKVGGRITGLSSSPESSADLELRGSYDNLAPITVAGKINPLAAKPKLDIKAEVRGVDMTPFSPYAAKYAGYGIEKGKLSLFVSYKIENQLLSADNRIFLDQLTFGEEVAGEGSRLPVKLAVALLQNRKGEIDINLPISGSLDDPQFSLGGIIAKVILNLFVKAVTSPFALIGSLFGGGGEELSSMQFDAGRAAVNAAGKTKLESIAKVLNERPSLKLEVEGNADPERDREGYKEAVLDRKVRRLKLNERVEKGVESDLADIQIDPKEYPALLEKVYRAENFPKPRNLVGMVKSLPVEEMERLILANTQVGEDDLRRLADRRAQRVRDFLVNQAGVPGERVFLLPSKLEKSEGKSDTQTGSRVDFSLK